MWYYQQGNERKGPVDEATIRSLISGGVISIDTLVWTEGMPSWVALQQTSLAAGLPVPPPSPAAFQAAANANAKDRVAYVLLAVLLGCGILWLFMWIWAIIEACTVTKDANGVAFK